MATYAGIMCFETKKIRMKLIDIYNARPIQTIMANKDDEVRQDEDARETRAALMRDRDGERGRRPARNEHALGGEGLAGLEQNIEGRGRRIGRGFKSLAARILKKDDDAVLALGDPSGAVG